jgi:hypothetical protein
VRTSTAQESIRGGTSGVGGAIAGADLDGSNIEPALIGGTNLAAGVAVDDTHL